MSFYKDVNWVYEHLGDIAVVDCRFHLMDPKKGKLEYEGEHLPGAYYFHLNDDLSGEIGETGGRHPLPIFEKLIEKLTSAGIGDDTIIVAYDDQNGAMASRFWWLLSYMGHKNTFVMKEGFSFWKEQGYPITDVVPPAKTASFSFKPNNNLLVHMNDVKQRLEDVKNGSVVLIDSRERERYIGLNEPIDSVAGHIPGAINKFWLHAKNDSKILENLPKEKEIIVYCGSGVTACPNVLLLKELGYNKVKLYAGSWSDWISYKENPIETGDVEG